VALLRETPGEMLRFDAVGKNRWHEAVSEMTLLAAAACPSPATSVCQFRAPRRKLPIALASRLNSRLARQRLPDGNAAACHRRRAAAAPMRGLRHA
jgi:hypothetical protein